MHPTRSAVPITMSEATARMRSGKLSIETAAIVPCTKAIMVASVSAAAPSTAITPARIFPITMLIPSLSFQKSRGWNGSSRQSLTNAGPIVGHQYGIAGIGRIIFHAGRLACRQAFQAKALFEAGEVLRGFVGDPGNGIAISNEAPQSPCGVSRWRGAARKQTCSNLRWSGRPRFDQFDDQVFHDP